MQALAQSLARAEPTARVQMLSERFSLVCQAPDEIAAFVRAGPPAEQGGAIPAPDWAALTEVCDDADAIVEQLTAAHGSDRAALMFDRCNFDRFGLTDAAGWLEGDPTSPIPFLAYQWLLDQAVANEDAKTLASAMLLRDRTRWDRPDVDVPTLDQALPRIPDGVVVYVTPTSIVVNDAVVGKIDGGRVAADSLRHSRVAALFDALAHEAEARRRAAEGRGQAWDGQLVIVADARIPHETLNHVMYTAVGATFHRYALVAKRDAVTFGAVPVSPPKVVAGENRNPGPHLDVLVTADGFRVTSSDATRAAHVAHLPRDEGGNLDFAALAGMAAEHKRLSPNADGASVDADASIAFGQLVRAMASVRGNGCVDDGAGCVLASVTVFPTPGLFDPGRTGLARVGTGGGGGDVGEGTIGLGDLGLIGDGGGARRGAGFGGRGKRLSRVRQAEATIDGALDPYIVRRIVRAHINEVRYCYDQGLQRNPKLKGRVTVRFTVSPNGKVTESSLETSTLDDAPVGNCVAKAVKRWRFPTPTDGKDSVVVYPFVLSPG